LLFRFSSQGNTALKLHRGFERDIHQDVVILVTETTVVNAHLKIGSVATTVEVEDNPPLIETTTNSLGDVVGSDQSSRSLW